MGQNILPCLVWKNTKESEHLTLIPKHHLSLSLTEVLLSTHLWIFFSDKNFSNTWYPMVTNG